MTIPGTYISNGTVFNHPVGHYVLYEEKSDVIRTVDHIAWLKDKSVWLPPTPYTGWRWERWVNPNGVHVYPPGGLAQAGHLGGGAGGGSVGMARYTLCLTGLPDSALDSKAVLKLRAAIKANKVQFGEAIAEAHQTISLIAESATTLNKATRALVAGDRKGFFRHLLIDDNLANKKKWFTPRKLCKWPGFISRSGRQSANRLLEFEFGWRPLLADIDGAAHQLADNASANPTRHRCKAYGEAYYPLNPITVHGVAGNSNEIIKDWSKARGRIGIRYTVYFSICNRVAAEAARNGLLDLPLTTTWNVTRWSFIADWVLPISSVLESLTALAGKDFLAGTRTEYYSTDVTRYATLVSTDQTGVTLNNVDSRERNRYATRTVLPDWPGVTLADLLHFRNPLSVTHAVESLALLAQNSRKFFT
jgi:hypothetical protein